MTRPEDRESLWARRPAGARPADPWLPPAGADEEIPAPRWVPPAPRSVPPGGPHVLSGWWRRAGAAVIDGLVLTVLAVALLALVGASLFDADGEGTLGAVLGFMLTVAAASVAALLYAPLLMARTNGQTLGRMVTGIRVVRTSGAPMTLGWAMLREVAVKTLLFGLAGSLTFGLASLLDVLWPLWDEENRALHDFPVNTRTVLA